MNVSPRAAAVLLLASLGSAAPLNAQDRTSARLAGLNLNLAGVLPDPWTDLWRSPARWAHGTGVYALYRAGEENGPDVLETGAVLSRGGRSGLGLRAHAQQDSLGDRAYGASLSGGLSAGLASVGARVDGVHDEAGASSGFAGALGLHAVGELGSVEIWGEFQAPDVDADVRGYAGEIALASPERNAAEHRLEPVLVVRGGRHEIGAFGLRAGGPVRWYEAAAALRRRWGAAGAFALALRRGEWHAEDSCDPGEVCPTVVDPAVGTHVATAIDAALELRVAAGFWIRAGGSWALDGTFAEYEALWPDALRRVGALRPGTVRGAFFGLGLRPAPRIRLDLYGYPGFLESHGAGRRIGRYGAQFAVHL